MTYPDRLSLKALVVMIVRHLHSPNDLVAVLAQPTAEMAALRAADPARRALPRAPHLGAAAGGAAGHAPGRVLITAQYGGYPHTGDGVEVRRVFH